MIAPDDPRHGSYAGAAAHWKSGEPACDLCKAAALRVRKRNLLRQLSGTASTVPAIGTARRIQALQALGWTQPQIADAAGLSVKSLRNPLLRGNSVYRSTAEAVATAYEWMSETEPSEHTHATRRAARYARTIATKRGWHAPIAWLGVDIDDPDATPDPGWKPARRLKHELVEEFEWLVSNGESAEQAARHLGVTVAAVDRARLRIEAAA